jgi:hypothetical protein
MLITTKKPTISFNCKRACTITCNSMDASERKGIISLAINIKLI